MTPLYKTISRMKNGEVFFGFSRSVENSVAFKKEHDFERIVLENNEDPRQRDGRRVFERYPENNWARRLARLFLSGAGLRAILRKV